MAIEALLPGVVVGSENFLKDPIAWSARHGVRIAQAPRVTGSRALVLFAMMAPDRQWQVASYRRVIHPTPSGVIATYLTWSLVISFS
jgi:hypothetical protein